MSQAYRVNRKVNDNDLIRYNNLGLSLKAIGQLVDCHPTTVKIRLDQMGIPVSDTRRSFMEDVYKNLTPSARDWIHDQVEQSGVSIKDLIVHLITGAANQSTQPMTEA